MIEHPDEQVRLGAARALGLMKSEAAVEPLRAMLMNGEGAAVTVAAEALGQIGTPAATDALLAALADPEMSPRRHAALGALETMGEPAVGPLTELLTSSRDAYARQNSAQALGWIGSSQATQALVDALQDRSEAVRGQAAWALAEIGDPAARVALERAVEGDGSVLVRVEAQQALSQLAEKPRVAADQPVAWSYVLGRLQPMRWLVLGMSVAEAAWLALGDRRLVPTPIRQRAGRQGQGRA
jgi:HEAT repeat protein